MGTFPMITINRKYGSGGHEIGEILAERLGLPWYDRDVITIAAQDSRMDEKAFERAETNLKADSRMPKIYGSPFNDVLFNRQSSIIRTLADKGPAIFVGRCADYVLHGYKPCIHIFLHASKEVRVQNVINRGSAATKESAEREIAKWDKARAAYYHYYTDRDWMDASHYDIVLDVSKLTWEEAADLLELFIKKITDKTE